MRARASRVSVASFAAGAFTSSVVSWALALGVVC
jgi:hypothetical protein